MAKPLLTLTIVFALSAPGFGQDPKRPAPAGPDTLLPADRETILKDLGILAPDGIPMVDAPELVGLPKGRKPGALTLEQAYTLALVRSRSAAARPDEEERPAPRLEPRALEELARRFEVGDFGRFRKDFLAAPPGEAPTDSGFRDPGPGFLDLTKQSQHIQNARRSTAAKERLLEVFRPLVETGSSALTDAQIDELDRLRIQATIMYRGRISQYRNTLDQYKVQLGLPPDAPLVVDHSLIAPFPKSFEGIERWFADPGRSLTDLPRMVDRLPALDDPDLGGVRLFTAVDDPDRLDDLLASAARTARQNRPGPQSSADRDARGLRIRHHVRLLLRIVEAYKMEKASLVLSVRSKDYILEQMIAPPNRSIQAAKLPLDLVNTQDHILQSEDRLVDLWVEYQTGKLALYRDLGALPARSWKEFYDSLRPRSRINDQENPQPPAAQTAAPAPPAPPAPR